MTIDLPISKSIANRVLLLEAMHGDPLMEVSSAMPDDVRLLHDVLAHHRATQDSALRATHDATQDDTVSKTILYDLQNCGTAMRFLTAYFAQLPGCDVELTGCSRMKERPIGQLVDALRTRGARIQYKEREGFPPLHIVGAPLLNETDAASSRSAIVLNDPQSTQFISALLLVGFRVESNVESPYVAMTRAVIQSYAQPDSPYRNQSGDSIEHDWSSAAFWLERWALGLCPLPEFPGLRMDSLQGDRVALDIFTRLRERPATIALDFSTCPDLYPAVAITCEQLGVQLEAEGTDSLRIKESDRLQAVREHKTYGDHRIAMALLAADLPCDDVECVSKSYPGFVQQLAATKNTEPKPAMQNTEPMSATQGIERLSDNVTRITPRRGINDEGRGKKYALRKLISQAETEYVWLTDDDVKWSVESGELSVERGERIIRECGGADMIIMPLVMSKGSGSLLCRLQQAEYAAIQQLTMEAAWRGRAVMCSGANLLVRRDRWLESYDDLRPELASGDDMFLLESFKRRGLRVAAWPQEKASMTSSAGASMTLGAGVPMIAPVESWRAFLSQRMRWAGKAPAYTDRDILCCGAVVLLANILPLLAWLMVFAGWQYMLATYALIFILKFPPEYLLIRKRDASVSLSVVVLLEVLYPLYMLLSLLGGILRPGKQTY